MNMNDYSVMKARVEACEMMRESLAVEIADKVVNNEAPGERLVSGYRVAVLALSNANKDLQTVFGYAAECASFGG